LHAISVHRASELPVAFLRAHLAAGILAVQLTDPLAGKVEDFHLQVIQLPPQQLNQREQEVTRYA